MVDLTILQSVSYIVGALGVGVAAIYYVLTLRTNQKNTKTTLETRQAQLLMNVYSKFTDPTYIQSYNLALTDVNWNSLEDYARKYQPTSREWTAVELVLNYYEGIGVLVEEGLLDVNLVAKLMSGNILPIWEKFSPLIIESRNRRGNPKVYDKTEYLYERLRKVRLTEFTYETDKSPLG